MQKSDNRNESKLKMLWHSSKVSSNDSSETDSPTHLRSQPNSTCSKPKYSLPLLQVWPNQDSSGADGQNFVFSTYADECIATNECSDKLRGRDSGIESTQVSPLPNGVTLSPLHATHPNENKQRSPSKALLHPDHARLLQSVYQTSSSQSSVEGSSQYSSGCEEKNENDESTHRLYLHSPSTASSMTSIKSMNGLSKGHRTCQQDKVGYNRRRSATTRYSLFDALDLECALLRAATRGSVGPYSLSESLHKLTFTQSLAFPALARGLANKRMNQPHSTRPSSTHESLLNTFAKVITAIVLFVVSILVFLIVYKFVKT